MILAAQPFKNGASLKIHLYDFVKTMFRAMLLLCVGINGVSHSVANTVIPPGLSSLSTADVRQAFIAFVNMTTAPGVEGSALQADSEFRDTDLWRSSLGFGAEFTLRSPIYNGYWGLALIGGGLDDQFELQDDFGESVRVEVDRDIVALRGSFGLSFPIDEHFKVRPFATLILSQSTTESSAQGGVVEDFSNNSNGTFFQEANVEAVSGAGSLDLMYSQWHERLALDLFGRYNIMYTDAFSIDNPALDTWAWSQSIFAKATLSGPTDWFFLNQNWRWNTYYSHNNYLDQSKSALGFRYLNEVGVGLDWDMHIKPFDWFGWRYLGIRAGYTFGDDVRGFNVGITAR